MTTPSISSRLTRRQALGRLAAGSIALALPRRVRAAAGPERLRLAFFGVGGRGRSNVANLASQELVAFADVDDARAAAAYREHPAVPHYRDYRRLLDRHAAGIDGVVISTPDHLHLPMALAALRAGKHVYLEKPLATTIWECQELQRAAEQARVSTQLGVHGHGFEALRVLREWIDAGAAGRVHTVVLWSDRLKPGEFVAFDAPAPATPVPETLDWDLWLGPRPARPYHPAYAPSRWRNWWNFGSGAVADIGVHMFDVLKFALDLGDPSLVTAESSPPLACTAPAWSRVEWTFPGVTVSWIGGYRDGRLVKPDDVPRLPRDLVQRTDNGMAFVGSEATLFIPDMRASVRPRIFPLERETEFVAARPPATLPRPVGGHYEDWLQAIRTGRPAGAPFSYGAPLTETVLLGTIAQRTGRPVRWSRHDGGFVDNPAAAELVRPPLRKGWDT